MRSQKNLASGDKRGDIDALSNSRSFQHTLAKELKNYSKYSTFVCHVLKNELSVVHHHLKYIMDALERPEFVQMD